jgi:hypothetical protein
MKTVNFSEANGTNARSNEERIAAVLAKLRPFGFEFVSVRNVPPASSQALDRISVRTGFKFRPVSGKHGHFMLGRASDQAPVHFRACGHVNGSRRNNAPVRFFS